MLLKELRKESIKGLTRKLSYENTCLIKWLDRLEKNKTDIFLQNITTEHIKNIEKIKKVLKEIS